MAFWFWFEVESLMQISFELVALLPKPLELLGLYMPVPLASPLTYPPPPIWMLYVIEKMHFKCANSQSKCLPRKPVC